ncbi:hypothetical protein LINPERHAP2_LOCUS26194 [Linum perenne]
MRAFAWKLICLSLYSPSIVCTDE